MKKKILSVILVVMMFAGCSSVEDDVGSDIGELVEQRNGGTLRLACVPVDTLNPLMTTHASVADVLSLVYEGLFETLPDMTVNPVLAKGYTSSENNTVYTIKLKDSVRFHDGRGFSAADVVATIDYIKRFGGRYSGAVLNVESYWAEGSDTVVLHLGKSVSDLMNRFDFPVLPAGLSDESFAQDSTFLPIGTGMYKYAEMVEHKNMRFEAFDEWHGSDHRAYIDSVDVSVLTDEKTIISAFDVGSIDLVSTSWQDYNDMNLTSSMFNVFDCEQNKFTFIGINCNRECFDSVQERRLLRKSIDTVKLTEDIKIGTAVNALVPMREGVYFNPAQEEDVKDVQVSDRYEVDEKMKKCTILYNSDNKTKSMLASAIKQQLETGGYTVTLDEQPFDMYTGKVSLDEYDLYIGEVKLDNSGNLSFMFGTERPGRLCNYFSSELETMILNLDLMDDPDDKIIAWNNFEKFYDNNVIQIPLYFTNSAVMVNKRISGSLEPNLSNLYSGLEELYIENEK